jgi:hypothetical protein
MDGCRHHVEFVMLGLLAHNLLEQLDLGALLGPKLALLVVVLLLRGKVLLHKKTKREDVRHYSSLMCTSSLNTWYWPGMLSSSMSPPMTCCECCLFLNS